MYTQENKPTLTNSEIYEILKYEIVTLELIPGQYISEIEIAKRFHVSRTPIREVFKHLEYDNLIRIIKNKGTVITPIDFRAISEFMFIREKIEIGIMEELLPVIQGESIAHLKLLLIKQRKLIKDPSLDLLSRAMLFFELDNDFHKAIFNVVNKSIIWKTLMNLMPDYQRFRIVSAEFNTENFLQSLFEHHTCILQCIQDKNIIELRHLYKLHIYSGVDVFHSIISEKENYFVL